MHFPNTWIVTPHVGAGVVLLGMTMSEVQNSIGAPCQSPDPVWGSTGSLRAGWHENALTILFSPRADYIEISRGTELDPEFLGIRVFEDAADSVVAQLVAKGYTFDRDDPELGYSYVFPGIDGSLWRPTIPSDPGDSDGQHFSSLGIGIRGYYAHTKIPHGSLPK